LQWGCEARYAYWDLVTWKKNIISALTTVCLPQDASPDIDETPLLRFETFETNFLASSAHRCRAQLTTVLLEVTQLIFDNDFLVHPINNFHVKNIKKLLTHNPNNFATPFLLEVVSEDCPTAEKWSKDPKVHSTWRYRVSEGNHGAHAKLDLWKAYGRQVFKNLKAWVYAGLDK
jgi:hypothetical protein